MIRLFNVYYPVRTLVLLIGEGLIVGLSFVLGTLWSVDSLLRLDTEMIAPRQILRAIREK